MAGRSSGFRPARSGTPVVGRLLVVLLLGAGGLAHAQGWREVRFSPGPRIVDPVLLDLNGDGRTDLLLVRGREASLYLQDEGGFDPERPLQRFRFVDQAILWTHADLDGDGRPEVLYLAPDGVYAYRWRGGRLSFVPRLVAATGAVLRAASPEEVRWRPFYQDLDGDGIRDLLLPGEGELLVYRGLPELEFEPARPLLVRPDVSVDTGSPRPSSELRSSYWYPIVHVGEANGDGRPDLFVHQRRQVVVFLQRERGRFGPRPDRVLPLVFAGPLPEGRFKLDLELPARFADVDGDGLTDVVATHVGRAVTYAFRGRADLQGALGTPQAVLRLPGITFMDYLADLDGDGRQDLVLGRTDRPGLWDLIRVLVTKEVSVEAFIYYGREQGLFPRLPDVRRRVDVPIRFASGSEGVEVGTAAVLSLAGDFDGDGRVDLLLRSGPERLAVYRNLGRSFADEPMAELRVYDMEGYRFVEPFCEDLNGDGRADVVLLYHSWDGRSDRLSVLVSAGGR
ncbi:MAG: hypothetical protein KatS3mg102_0742 [Planctomycetota bacterium]|nr:MAG: hypothetical protein KatS3mg102_0742 [Planctomycetota bacterium]